jgi:SAM-dependent methyltransferase
MSIFQKLFFLWWYFRDPPWDTNQSPPELYEFIRKNPPGSALDLGCGTGTNVITLIKHNWQATGLDFIPRAIRKARRNATLAGVQAEFQVADVTRKIDLPGPYDLILDMGCYHSLDSSGMAGYRHNIQRLLAVGGTFLLYIFFRSPDDQSGSGFSEQDLTPFLDFLELVKRQDGTERGLRPSAWLTYQKPTG